MRYVVVGPGAVGGVVAARLALAGRPVAVVARGAHLEAIRRDGLALATPDGVDTVAIDATAAVTEVRWQDDDVVLVAVKSQDTHDVLTQLASAAPPSTPVVCLQNGVANEPAALRWFGDVYGVVVILPATHLEPGVVAEHSSPTPGLLDIGRWPTGTDERCERIAVAFRSAGFDARVLDDVSRWKHAKLLMNLGNVVDALFGRDDPSRRLIELVRDEAHRCLDAAGIAFASRGEDRERRADLLNVQDAHGQPRRGSSSWQSLARRTGTIETDYFNGEIVRLGRLHGIPTPVNARLQELAREHARHRRDPGALDPDALLGELENPV